MTEYVQLMQMSDPSLYASIHPKNIDMVNLLSYFDLVCKYRMSKNKTIHFLTQWLSNDGRHPCYSIKPFLRYTIDRDILIAFNCTSPHKMSCLESKVVLDLAKSGG